MQEELLREKFNILEFERTHQGAIVKIEPAILRDVLYFLKNTAEFDFDMLYSIVASDFVEYFQLDYILMATRLGESLIVRIELGKGLSSVESVLDVYPSADWDEREIFDLFGVSFLGRGVVERLLMPKGWVGHPLRKDYVQEDVRLGWNNG